MKVFSGFIEAPNEMKGAAIALGAFDGLHQGHKALMMRAKKNAPNKMLGLLLFEPPPKLFFSKDKSNMRLATERVTERLAAKVGVDIIFTLKFDYEFSQMPALDFINQVIINGFAPNNIVVGHDFRFGKGREGDAQMLKQYCATHNIEVEIIDRIDTDDGVRISSSLIREALKNGEISRANQLLGHPWMIEGVVEHGQKLGRQLGFPTANLKLYEQIQPKFGIYAVKVDIGDKIWRNAVANFGRTPTTGMRDPLFEAHILDFEGDIYDRNIFVEVHEYLRAEEKFPSLDALIEQMKIDVINTRAFFDNN
ncbi:MAG: riboflavin biosynthesis protein RibF [Caulobacterales bacterium]|nr:riboflavin biosynthesis protein RibF [Caulobacterales bacterium]